MPESNLPAQIDHDLVITEDGESVPLTMIGVDTFASWIDQLRDSKKAADHAMAIISAEMVRRADLLADTSVPGQQRLIRVTGAAPTPRWDPQLLRTELAGLVHDGVLEASAVDGVVTTEQVWKVDTTRMKKLLKLAAVRKAVDPLRLPDEDPIRRVTSTSWL